MVNNVPIVIVAGMGNTTQAIGQDNGLLWHVPADLKRFKALTVGKPVIMGRKTFASILTILGKPLPDRTNIVVTRQTDYTVPPGVLVAPTLEAAFTLALAENPTEIHIGGGAELYRQALPVVDRLYLTLFHDNTPGDTAFPPFRDEFTLLTSETAHHESLQFEWTEWVRTR